MNARLPLIAALAFTLGGCSSLSGLFAFQDTPDDMPAAAAQTAVAAPVAPDDAWCQRVAAGDRIRAQASGFDAATLDRMTLQSYQQCRALAAK